MSAKLALITKRVIRSVMLVTFKTGISLVHFIVSCTSLEIFLYEITSPVSDLHVFVCLFVYLSDTVFQQIPSPSGHTSL